MNNSNYSSINRIIEVLFVKTEKEPGTLNITGVDDITQVNIELAQVKYWNALISPTMVISPAKLAYYGKFKIMIGNKTMCKNVKRKGGNN